MEPVLIVGAGMAGLAAAIDLAVAGYPVTLVEREARPGGKMAETIVAGRAIDCGPTVLTMAGVFERLFADAGATLADHVRLTPAQILARHHWGDGTSLDLFADEDRTADAIGDFAGARDARGYCAFTAAARTIHRTLADSFMTADKPRDPLALLWRGGLRGLPGFTRIDPYRSLSTMVATHFRDPRLRQLFGRYATYCGSSPYRAPATLALVADVERDGVWLVEGGMARLADALLALAERLGVETRFGATVDTIVVAQGRAAGVRLASGETLAAARVVLTADAAALAAGCFGEAAAKRRRPFAAKDRSYSAFTIAAVAATDAPLSRHSIYFSDDAASEFAALDTGRMPADPTVYVCAQDRGAGIGDAAPGAPERLFLVLNAPADGDTHAYSPQETDQWSSSAWTRLARSGLTLSPLDCSTSTPSDFARRFPATGGALYGRASHGWTASFRRPGARTAIPGLYLAGGSVHPGAGVPMAALSGRAAARAVLRDAPGVHASTSTFRRAAMAGGISTPSATTAATA